MSEDTPTQRLSQPDPEPGGDGGGARMSKKLLITLISIGGALLIAVIVLLVVLLTSGGGDDTDALPSPSVSDPSLSPSPTPSASENESPTPEPSPSESEEEEPAPPPPPSNDPKINSFTASTTTFVCPAPDVPFDDIPPLSFDWTTTNVSEVWFGIDTSDASAGPYAEDLPGNGDIEIFIGCPVGEQQTHKYTLTVAGNGMKVHKSINVVIK